MDICLLGIFFIHHIQKVFMDELTLMFGTAPLRIERSQLIFWIRH